MLGRLHSLALLYLGNSVIGGIGLGFGYISPISTLAQVRRRPHISLPLPAPPRHRPGSISPLLLTNSVQLHLSLSKFVPPPCFLTPPPPSLLPQWFPDRRGLAMGLAVAGFGGGAVIGAPLAAQLMTHYPVWKTFVVLGVLDCG